MTYTQWKESDIKRMIYEGDKRSLKGRSKRLSFLLSLEHQELFPAPALAYEYYEEARLCWVVGAFVATIVMTQLSFEELFRSHYRVAKGVSGKLNCGKKVDDARCYELIEEAKNDEWISRKEAKLLNNLRKNIRNPYVHVKDIKVNEDGKQNVKEPNFFKNILKIQAPELIGSDIEEEAKETIYLLITLSPEISRRVGGI